MKSKNSLILSVLYPLAYFDKYETTIGNIYRDKFFKIFTGKMKV
jgi:hypothetical protein